MQHTAIATNGPIKELPIKISTEVLRKKGNPHIHSHTQMSYVLAGTMKHFVDGKEYIQTPGSCVIVPAYTLHTIDTTISEDTPGVVFITFHDNFLTERGHKYFSYSDKHARFEGYTLPIFSELTEETKDGADELMRALRREFNKRKDMSFDKISDMLCSFFRLLCTDLAKDNDIVLIEERANAITNAVKYIEDNYSKKITIDDLCGMATMSRCLFTKHFKAITGMTVASFILSVRLQRAVTKILFTEKTLDKIAREVGLYDKSRLSHAFSKEFGITPTEYRKKVRPLTIAEHVAFLRRWKWFSDDNETF
ncbi:MAG: AraC family transcriptional regulator [Oscillospiraceae bacterium]|nr:AraC family transcriptional regulator [Oscillospiraceae bacterium]